MHVPISGPLSLILETAFLSGYLGGEFCEWDLDDPEIKTINIYSPLYCYTSVQFYFITLNTKVHI